MQRKFVTNLFFLVALNFLIKPFWILGIDRTVQNIVGSADYGFYFAIFNFSLLFNILLDFGISNFNNRNIAQNRQLLNKHFSGIIMLKLILIAVYGIVIFVVGYGIGYDSKQFYFLALVGVNQALLSFILYLRSNISGLFLFKTDSFISVLDRFLMIIICGILIWGNIFKTPFQIEWLIYSQTLAYLITLIVALSIVVQKSKFQRVTWNISFIRMIIKKSLPYAFLLFLMGIYSRVDTVFIERLLPEGTGEYQSGIFAQAYRLFDAGNNMALLFGVILLPIFSRMIKKRESVEGLVRLSFTIIFTFAVIAAIVSCFYSDEIMRLLYFKHENETMATFYVRMESASKIFGILMFSFIGVCTSYIFGTLLTALGNLKFMIKIAIFGVLINLIINLVFIPKLEAVGAAYASLGSQLITAIALILGVVKSFSFMVNYAFLSKLTIFVLLVFGMGLGSRYLQLNLAWGFTAVLMVSLISAYMLKLLDLGSFILMLRQVPDED